MTIKLILVHGILGFGSNELSTLVGINYFRNISRHIDQNIIKVYEPSVNPIGTVDSRSKELLKYIENETKPTDEVHIIAHSMGGLDAKRAIHNNASIQNRIKTLVTIGTPHTGSEVADAIVNGTNISPKFKPVVDFFPRKDQGILDLTINECSQHNEDLSNINIKKYCIAGNPKSIKSSGKLSLLFKLASELGGIQNKDSDGVVTRNSALKEGWKILPDWPADHAALIGWDLDILFFTAPDHVDRYMHLIEKITEISKDDFYIP